MNGFRTKIIFIALFFLLGGILLNIAYSQAQNRVKFSSAEDVVIAFYKTGGIVPNFENWIKERDPYKHTPVARRPRVMAEQLNRLRNAYQNYNPSEDHLILRTAVSLEPNEIVNEAGEKTYTLQTKFTAAPEALYFPYDFMEQRISLIPINIEKILMSALSQEKFDFLNENLRQSSQNTMILRLRPKKAETNKPFEIDGVVQWGLSAEIVSAEIWSKRQRLLWEYTAPWYIAPAQQKIQNLYTDRPNKSPEQGSVKSLDKKILKWEN